MSWGGPPGGRGGWGGGPPGGGGRGGWGGGPPAGGAWGPPPGGAPPGGSWGPPAGGAWGAPPGGAPPGGAWGGAPPGSTMTTTTSVAPPPSGFGGNWYSGYYNNAKPNALYEIMGWFQSIDRDRSGHITANEIATVTFGGFPLGMDTASRLVRVFDKDKSNSIDFHEYAAMHGFLNQLQTAFFAGDKDRSGRLDAREINNALNHAGLTIKLPAVQALMKKFDTTGHGVTFPDFLSLAATIAQAKSLIQWKGRSGTVSLDLDGLVEMVGYMS